MDNLFGVTEMDKKIDHEHAFEAAEARESAEKRSSPTVTEKAERV